MQGKEGIGGQKGCLLPNGAEGGGTSRGGKQVGVLSPAQPLTHCVTYLREATVASCCEY